MVKMDVGESMKSNVNFQLQRCNTFCLPSPMSDTNLEKSQEPLQESNPPSTVCMGKHAHISAAMAEGLGRPIAVQCWEKERWPPLVQWCIPVITQLKVAWEEDNYSRRLTVPPIPTKSAAISYQLSSTSSANITPAPTKFSSALTQY